MRRLSRAVVAGGLLRSLHHGRHGYARAVRHAATPRGIRRGVVPTVLWHVPRVSPEGPLQLLGRQPAPEASPRALLGPADERLAGRLLRRSQGSGSPEAARAFSSFTQSRAAAPGRPVCVPSRERSGALGAEPGLDASPPMPPLARDLAEDVPGDLDGGGCVLVEVDRELVGRRVDRGPFDQCASGAALQRRDDG